jgi:hypothetical protein
VGGQPEGQRRRLSQIPAGEDKMNFPARGLDNAAGLAVVIRLDTDVIGFTRTARSVVLCVARTR